MNRCANTEALNRYEREIAKAEKEYEAECKELYGELDEAIDMIEHIISRNTALRDEAVEYVKDRLG